MLVACRVSHNFISVDLVHKLGIPCVDTSGYGVLMAMATGLTVKGEDLYTGVVLTLQGLEIVDNFLPFELGSSDVILGMQWLESLGGMQMNWKDLTMEFKVGRITVTLQGDPSF